jgi:hypothetical protein
MRHLSIIFNLLAAGLILSACSRDDGICFGGTGNVVTEERIALPFREIELNDNINLVLTYDSTLTRIAVEAGENLQAGIITRIDSGRLILENRNQCDWLRSFEVPITVHVTFTALDTLVFRAAGNVSCTNTWEGDSVYVEVVEGAGLINLNIDAFRSQFHVRYGTTRVDLHGFSQVCFISNEGYGPFHAENLATKFNYIYTSSPNDVFVNSTVEMAVEISNIGNVYYTGSPASISTNIYGEGKLIPF